MKTIRLTAQQRKDISERRRQAQDRRGYQRLSAIPWSDDGRTREEIAKLVGVSTRQVGQWFRIFRNKGLVELCTLHYKGDPGRLRPARSNNSSKRSPRGRFTPPSKSAPGSTTPSVWPIRPRASRSCSTGSGPATTRSRASFGRPTSRSRSSSCGSIGGTNVRRGRRHGGIS